MNDRPSTEQELKEGDLVEITATGKVEFVADSGRVLVRVHGELVPMFKDQVRRIPDEPKEPTP